MKKPLKITLIICASLVALILIVAALVSPIAKSYVNRHGEQLVGRKISVEKLRVNLFGGQVRLNDFCLYEEDASTEFLSFDTLDVKVCLRKLLHHEVDVRHVTLAALDVKVLQEGDKFNFSSILDHFAPEEEAEEDTTSGTPWKLGFYNIRLCHWKVYYADVQRGSEWNLKDLNIEVPGIYFSGDQNTDAGLELALADGGTLRTKVLYNMERNDFDVTLGLHQFAISNVRAYLTDAMNVGTMEGVLDGDLKVVGNLSQLLKMKIGGSLELKDIDIRDYEHSPVLAFDKLHVDVDEIVLDDNTYTIKEVELAGLNSHFDRYKKGSNFAQFFAVEKKAEEPKEAEKEERSQEETHQEEAAPAEPKPFRLKVGKLDIHGGAFAYNDLSLPDPFHFPVSRISIQAENVDLSSTNQARISATLPHSGHLNIQWKGTLDDIKEFQHLVVNITNLQLADVSPYSVAFLGQPFTDGTFSFISDNTIQHSQLEGTNRIDMYKPAVGERRKDVDSALHLPLKAALYVLTDKDGKVVLDVPISGNLDNPEFSYMKAVWKTLGNLFVKVATSPMRALGNALGIDSEKLDFIAVDSSQVEFTSEQYYQFGQLASVVKYDPSVRLFMTQQLDQNCSSATVQRADDRNARLLAHMKELGANTDQIVISNELVVDLKKGGYAVNTQLVEE